VTLFFRLLKGITLGLAQPVLLSFITTDCSADALVYIISFYILLCSSLHADDYRNCNLLQFFRLLVANSAVS